MATTNDFIGSFAQENVSFTTQLVKTSVFGDNFWKVMVFTDNARFLEPGGVWTDIPGSSFEVTPMVPGNPGDDGVPGTSDNNETADTPAVMSGLSQFISVTADDYGARTKGLLNSWMYDLFCNGFTGEYIIVPLPAQAKDKDKTIKAMESAYHVMKPYAYHKTVCAGADTITQDFADICNALAGLCKEDKMLLSAAPYFPYSTATPSVPESDLIYKTCFEAGNDAFMACYADATRNAALYSLGLVLSVQDNGSGTCVGSSIDMTKSSLIQSSGPGGTQLDKDTRDILEVKHVQTFKPVGDNSGNVAAIGTKTILGDTMQATWIVAYITYMTKVGIAKLITTVDYIKNASNYTTLVGVMVNNLNKFGPAGSGRLSDLSITAPAFENLPAASGNEIVIPNAWSATYTDHVRSVKITGSLTIGV